MGRGRTGDVMVVTGERRLVDMRPLPRRMGGMVNSGLELMQMQTEPAVCPQDPLALGNNGSLR